MRTEAVSDVLAFEMLRGLGSKGGCSMLVAAAAGT
jgi:hypothetical protein